MGFYATTTDDRPATATRRTARLSSRKTPYTRRSRNVHSGPGIDNLLAFTTYTGATAKTYFCLTDVQGTVHALADETGTIVESYRFDAWGRVLGVYNGSGIPLTESAIGNRFLWQGKEYSWRTGLYHNRHRVYDPITGRFLSKDPSGISGGLNEFIYCFGNPVNFFDPDGLDTYRQNRKIGGKVGSDVKSNKNPLSHTYVFTTNPDGTIEHTYSWGNAANPHGWNIDQPEDIAAAQEALKTPKTLKKKGCDELDPYVHKVFQDLNKPANEHRWWPWNQCKSEADDLLEKAQKLLDDAKKKAGK